MMNSLQTFGSNVLRQAMNTYIAWDLDSFLKNSKEKLTSWGSAFLMVLGVIGIIYCGYQIVTGLMSHGKKPTNWGVVIILLFVSGALLATGLTLLIDISSGGEKTIRDLGGGVHILLSRF